ncbi:hypothetical protein Tco_0054554 [Tanacetum coccineum]
MDLDLSLLAFSSVVLWSSNLFDLLKCAGGFERKSIGKSFGQCPDQSFFVRIDIGKPEKEKGFIAFVRLVRLRCQIPRMAPNVEVNLRGLLELDKSDLSGNKDRMELITPDLICPSTYQLLRNSSGNSGPDLSFDKSASPEPLFSLARVSLAEASKPVLSFGCSGGDYTSSNTFNT